MADNTPRLQGGYRSRVYDVALDAYAQDGARNKLELTAGQSDSTPASHF